MSRPVWRDFYELRARLPSFYEPACWFDGVWALSVVAASLTLLDDGRWVLPLAENGEPCPFPLDPLLIPYGAPLGQYHCPYCGDMVIAGMPHGDWRNVEGDPEF